eukprot:scaffold32320_cov38-Phaeocystis_antarctica.AAC.1
MDASIVISRRRHRRGLHVASPDWPKCGPRPSYAHAAHARADGFLFLYSQERRQPVPKAPRDAGAVPAERPAAVPRAEAAPAPEVEEVAAPRPNKMEWSKERKEMLLTQITACGLSAFMTCRGNKKPDKNGKGGI